LFVGGFSFFSASLAFPAPFGLLSGGVGENCNSGNVFRRDDIDIDTTKSLELIFDDPGADLHAAPKGGPGLA